MAKVAPESGPVGSQHLAKARQVFRRNGKIGIENQQHFTEGLRESQPYCIAFTDPGLANQITIPGFLEIEFMAVNKF